MNFEKAGRDAGLFAVRDEDRRFDVFVLDGNCIKSL